MSDMDIRTLPYGWGDIADALTVAKAGRSFPMQLVKADVYWDQLTFHVRGDAHRDEVLDWLKKVFPLRINNGEIRLDGPKGFSSSLPFEIILYDEDFAGKPPANIASQYVAASTQIWFAASEETSPVLTADFPTFAFHSVKGGVGRTTSAISFALSLVEHHQLKPLLVDADFEAPGISYLFLNDGRECHFSLEDLIVLAHADDDPVAAETVRFGSSKLANQSHEGITFLPCLRRADMLSAFAIRPEQLQRSHSSQPFFLLKLLQDLARASGCNALIIDLRAGFTDLAAMVLCAPGIAPIFVTTASGQAVLSTQEMLQFIGNETQKNNGDRWRPAIILNNVIAQVRRSAEFSRILDALETSAESFIAENSMAQDGSGILDLSDEDLGGSPIVTLDHAPTLTAAASNISDFVEDLRPQACFDQLRSGLESWTQRYLAVYSEKMELEQSSSVSSSQIPATIQKQREALTKVARQRIFAESTFEPNRSFLAVRALRELAERFRTETPNATCIGMKGAGKTFTFVVLSKMKTWNGFLAALPNGTVPSSVQDAVIVPVLPARNLQLSEFRAAGTQLLGGEAPVSSSTLYERIEAFASRKPQEAEWSRFWLDVAAWSCGIGLNDPDAGNALLSRLVTSSLRIVALFDGLEETFQNFRHDASQQAAIRGLTSSLPQFLLEVPGRPLGQINFVRSDLIAAAFPNNSRQFADRNRSFALTWHDRDILELAAWLASQAGTPVVWNESFQNKKAKEISDALLPLWGRKLGKPDELSKGGRTREPRSAEWVIAALSDLRGRLTARDLVGFIAESAEMSIGDTNSSFNDRLLTPRAMMNAIGPVGSEKMRAMVEEIPQIKEAVDALRTAPGFNVPLSLTEFKEKIPAMNEERITLLEDNGIILLDGEAVEMPEIFRASFTHIGRKTGGRRSIVGLMNKARKLRASDIAI